jgi:uncharacterized membrane protein YraQ (UPF0718 family)
VSEATKKHGPRWAAGGWIFLGLVLAVYVIIGLAAPEVALKAVSFFVNILGQVIPVLVLVFVLIFAFDLVLNPATIERYLGRTSGLKGWLVAIVAGVLSAGPVYAWYAVLAELRKKGMRTSLMAAFLYNRAVKFPLLPLMVHYFGVRYTLVLSLYLIVFSIISGVVMERVMKNSPSSEAARLRDI